MRTLAAPWVEFERRFMPLHISPEVRLTWWAGATAAVVALQDAAETENPENVANVGRELAAYSEQMEKSL